MVDRIARQEAGEAAALPEAEAPPHPNLAVIARFDPADLDRTIDVFAGDAVWHFFNPLLPDFQGDFVGHAGIRAFFDGIAQRTGGSFAVHPVSVTPVGDELLVAHTRNAMDFGDHHVETDVVVVWRIVEGRIAEVWDIPSVHPRRGSG